MVSSLKNDVASLLKQGNEYLAYLLNLVSFEPKLSGPHSDSD